MRKIKKMQNYNIPLIPMAILYPIVTIVYLIKLINNLLINPKLHQIWVGMWEAYIKPYSEYMEIATASLLQLVRQQRYKLIFKLGSHI